MTGVVDNDVLYKGACYGLLAELAAFVDLRPALVGVLGAAPFVVRAAIGRATLRTDKAMVLDRFDKFITTTVIVEPTNPEQDLAAAIEYAAQRQALPLHSGESQLCAIAAIRGLPRMLTGDKQAIMALEQMLESQPALVSLVGRVFCLEHAILSTTMSIGTELVRSRVCSEPTVDTALSMCFSCATGDTWKDDSANGLRSYIESLRADAARVLAA